MKAVIFLNGAPYGGDVIKADGDIFIAADGAYNWAGKRFEIDVVLGDMDSCTQALPHIKKVVHPAEKDYTDGLLAVMYAAEAGYKQVEIYGAWGGRSDHQYANLCLLEYCRTIGIDAVIRDGAFSVYLVDAPRKFKLTKNSTVSIVPFSDKAHIKDTKGLKYPIKNKELTKCRVIGISNTAAQDEIYINVSGGTVLVFIGDGDENSML